MSGLKLKGSFATLAKITIQPKPVTTPPAINVLAKVKIPTQNLFTAVSQTSKPAAFAFAAFDHRIIQSLHYTPPDTRYSDELPRSKSKFTPFEEISGISGTRPEILSVSEFKPIFSNNGLAHTPAGAFLDAQVKLMNLRHEALATLINDLKKDQDIAEQLDQIEGDFLKHVSNLKSRVDFLATLQTYVEKNSKMLDLRDAQSTVDSASVLKYFFSSVFTNLPQAQSTVPACTYADLLSQHGFNKNSVSGFSSTKVFLQTLYEAKKTLRAGSDELIGTDPALANRDVDPVTINARVYQDPHIALENVAVTTFDNVKSRNVHESDSRLTALLRELEANFRNIDKVYAGSTSEEVRYTLKLQTLAREVAYSNALSSTATTKLLGEYGYPIRTDIGNQQLFDAVYGQLGTRITDDRSGNNANSVSSVASRIDGDRAILTYEVDYLDDEQGSVYTPGGSYYVASAVRPSDTGAFSHERAAELVTRMSAVVDRYMTFIGRFNLLPRVGNIVLNQMASSVFVIDPSAMTNALYQLFVENSTGYLRADVVDSPIVDFMCEAATNPALRANLLMFFSTVTNASGDGLSYGLTSAQAESVSHQIETSSTTRGKVFEENARVSPTIDKLIKNCVSQYKFLTGDYSGAAKIENHLKNFNEQGPLSRAIAYVKSSFDVYKTAINAGYTLYSHISDLQMVALTVQAVLDTARRYAYNRTRTTKGASVNSNYLVMKAASKQLNVGVQQTTNQMIVNSMNKSTVGTSAFVAAARSFPLTVSNVSKLPLKQAVIARLEREDLLMLRTALAPLHAMRLVRDNLKEFVLYLQKSENTNNINDILNIVGDRKLVELLADKGQIRILYDTVDTVLQKINLKADNKGTTDIVDVVSLTRSGSPSDDLKVFDDSFVTSRTANILKAAFTNAKYKPNRGANVRVIAFGLPHGFSTHLENKFKISTFVEQVTAKRKQNDVIVADVYKVDVRYPDLIFKPIPKVFELSRFVVRDEREYGSVGLGTSLDTILDAIPTKDYSNFSNITTTKAGEKSLSSSDYSFMTSQDATTMLRNTKMSYLLELYYRLLTGIPLSERELYVQDPDENDKPAPYITQAILQNTITKTFKLPPDSKFAIPNSAIATKNMLVGAPVVTKQKVYTVERPFSVTATIPIGIKGVVNQIAAIATTANQAAAKKTVYIDKATAAKYMMSPKLFERVFFVDVDPDDFEIDRDETFKSKAGKATFAQLQQAGEVETKSETLARIQRDSFYLKDHSSEKQMTFEKYFVVVRAYTPLTTRTR